MRLKSQCSEAPDQEISRVIGSFTAAWSGACRRVECCNAKNASEVRPKAGGIKDRRVGASSTLPQQAGRHVTTEIPRSSRSHGQENEWQVLGSCRFRRNGCYQGAYLSDRSP